MEPTDGPELEDRNLPDDAVWVELDDYIDMDKLAALQPTTRMSADGSLRQRLAAAEALVEKLTNWIDAELAECANPRFPDGIDPIEAAQDSGFENACEHVQWLLQTAPYTVLAEVKADAWDEGWRAGGKHQHESTLYRQSLTIGPELEPPVEIVNPYRG